MPARSNEPETSIHYLFRCSLRLRQRLSDSSKLVPSRYLRLRRVVWRGVVSHILRALEHAEGEAGQEVAGSEQTSGRAESEASML